MTPRSAVFLFFGILGLLITVGSWFQRSGGLGGLVGSELFVIALPVLLAARRQGLSSSSLGLRWPGGRALCGGALAGLGGFHLVAALVEPIAPLPPTLREDLRRLIVPENGLRPLGIDLTALALVPAVCEELLFRGVLLTSWRRWGPTSAALASAFAFGLFHLDLHKFLPTACLGLLASLLALPARSALPAMAMHATHNALVVCLVRHGHEDSPQLDSPWGLLLTAGAVASLVAGLHLVRQSKALTLAPPPGID